MIIAFAGKGGTGKTTLAGMMIKYLLKKGQKPILAVDADANSNLNDVLGLKVDYTLGEAREEMKKGNTSGMTKDIFMEMKVQESVVEGKGFDLLTMGRPEGAGCYCAANHLLSEFIEKLSKNYPYLVIDNEAGMEHISRLTTKQVDLLFMVSDASKRAIVSAKRIHELVDELGMKVGKRGLVVNRSPNGLSPELEAEIKAFDLPFWGTIPQDEAIYRYDLEGKPTLELPETSRSVKKAFEIFNDVLPVFP
jgi:CO dehydrogenase maturation factor